jgi:hypothetical protein
MGWALTPLPPRSLCIARCAGLATTSATRPRSHLRQITRQHGWLVGLPLSGPAARFRPDAFSNKKNLDGLWLLVDFFFCISSSSPVSSFLHK